MKRANSDNNCTSPFELDAPKNSCGNKALVKLEFRSINEGLGVIDLKSFNHALLTKWRWQWHSPKQRLWKQLMEALYCTEGKQHVSNSFLFGRHLKDTEQLCYTFMQWEPGAGDSIIFWKSDWGKGIMKYRFPTLYTHANSTERTLQQAARSRISDLFRPVMSEQASGELQVLQNEILKLRNQQTTIPDEVRWKPDSKGRFTVKSVYYALKDGPRIDCNLHRIWKLEVPPRYRVFEWLLQNNRILTADNLQCRGYSMAGVCYMCRTADEMVMHLFSACSFSAGVYDVVMQQAGVRKAAAHMCSIEAVTEGTLGTKGKSLLLISHFVIWRERCSCIFKGTEKKHEDLIQEVLDVWHTMQREITSARNSQ